MMTKRGWMLFVACALMLGGLIVAMFGCASWTIGTDDNRYIAMVQIHRQRCPGAPYTLPCDNESDVLTDYRNAIQAYATAKEIPGSASYQKARLKTARAAARKLFPSQ